MLTSLRYRLLFWLLIPLGLLLGAGSWYSYSTAVQTASLIQDRSLATSADVLAGGVSWQKGQVQVVIAPAAMTLFSSRPADLVFYQLRDETGRLLAGRDDLAVPQPLQTNGRARTRAAAPGPWFFDLEYEQRVMRGVLIRRILYDAGAEHSVSIMVVRSTNEFNAIKSGLWYPVLYRQFGLLVLTLCMMIIALRIELRPLQKLNLEMSRRDGANLNPLRFDTLQLELRPIVEATNQYIQRINQQVAARRRFIADAAHQLRTPLALLAAQLDFARRHADDPRVVEAIVAVQQSSSAMNDLVSKLLMLSQAESARVAATLAQPVDLVRVAPHVLEELASLALHKRIDLGFETTLQTAWTSGHEVLLSSMLTNLVDNAIRYTPQGGEVTLSIRRIDVTDQTDALRLTPLQTESGLEKKDSHDAYRAGIAASSEQQRTRSLAYDILVTVTDSGPGIAPELRSRVFERFFRAQSDQPGTGLGLAIVKEIVLACGGNVSLATPASGKGLSVYVRLPGRVSGAAD